MPRTCTVCRHSERTAIDEGLVGGTPRRELARRYGLSATAVRRHADAHLPHLMAQAAQADQARGAGLLERVHRIVTDLERLGAECRDAGEHEKYLRTARELIHALELQGRVTGELQTGTTINVLVGIWQRLGVKDEADAQRRIAMTQELDGLDREARNDLMRRALEAEGWHCTPPGQPSGARSGALGLIAAPDPP